MAQRRNVKRVFIATAMLAAAAGGVVAHADTLSQRVLLSPNQDLSGVGVTAPQWPAIPMTCTADCTVAVDAGTGTATVADEVNGPEAIEFLGFNVNGANGGEHTLAGGATSTIKVPSGTKLTITFTHADDPALVLSFPSLAASAVVRTGDEYIVDTAGFVGTSVFQPGSNPLAPREVAQGLVGVLIVTPLGCDACAYDPVVPYADEAIVATTDLDAEFAADPPGFDMSYFGQPRDVDDAPRQVYHLINGKAFPDTDVIDVHAGDDVLLRYVNAGVTDKSMGLLGGRQSLLGRNASAYVDPQTFIAPLVGPGETAEVAVHIAGNAMAGQRYSLMDQGRQMNHGTASGFGGALTFLNVWTGTPPPDPDAAVILVDPGLAEVIPADPPVEPAVPPGDPPVGPAVPPAPGVPAVIDSETTTFAAPDQLTVNASSAAANITAVAWASGAVEPPAEAWTLITGGAFGGPTYSFTATLVPPPAPGTTVWVRVQDSSGTWSAAHAVATP